MSTMSFEMRPKEEIIKEREEREKTITDTTPKDLVDTNKFDVAKKGTVIVYKPAHGKQIIRKYTSFDYYKKSLTNLTIDQFVDECIKDATSRGIINFIHITPEHNHVYIGIEGIMINK